MTDNLLKFVHIPGAILMGAGLVAVWMSDLRSRQLRELRQFAEAVRNIAVFYDGLVVPGAVLLLASGTWMIMEFYGGFAFLGIPWLASMVVMFLAEFIEGNTVTRLYFMRLRRMTRRALEEGASPRNWNASAESWCAGFARGADRLAAADASRGHRRGLRRLAGAGLHPRHQRLPHGQDADPAGRA
ncbi:MAG: DUF2269 domain-containing protein [Burkholderiaceae bacterium]|nr:DUF2269 domain-containing protein [Burkholderiaceae bacterium]